MEIKGKTVRRGTVMVDDTKVTVLTDDSQGWILRVFRPNMEHFDVRAHAPSVASVMELALKQALSWHKWSQEGLRDRFPVD